MRPCGRSALIVSMGRVTVSNLEELEASYEQTTCIGETIKAGNAVHNIDYADVVLAVAKQKLERILTQTQP